MTNSKSEIASRVRAGRPLDHIPVVDFHCHLGASSDYYYIPRNTASEVAANMDRFGIDHLVTFTILTSSDVRVGNDLQYAAAEAFPRRFSALTMLHAQFPQDWIPLLKEGVRRGTRGIKLISQYQHCDEETIDWSPALDFARDRGWVVLHHYWGSPERMERWAKSYPKLAFIEGHAGVRFKKLMDKYDNIYQCTCACFVNWGCSFMTMYNNLPVDRILYGSDALDLDFGTGISPIALADIPESAKEKILGGNAVRLMKKLQWKINLVKGASA